MFVAGSNHSSGSDSSGRDEVASSPIQFVAGNYALDADEDEFGFEQAMVRSSPSPNLMAANPMFEARCDDDAASPCLINECNTERTVRGAPSPVAPPKFASLAIDYPIAMTSKQFSHQLPLSSTSKPYTKQERETSMVAPLPPSKTGKMPPPPTSSIPMDSLLNGMTDVTQADQRTVIMEPATMRMDQDSASQRTAVDGEDSDMGENYEYKPSKNEQDDIEQLKWNIQQEQFQRTTELDSRLKVWGTLEEQNSRVFFIPGSRRAAILTEKRFHDEKMSSGMGTQDPWYQERRQEFEELVREFYRDETKHKQELMLNRLEKISPFYKLPVLGNRFLLVRLRGKGGNGEVWDVIDYVDNKKFCALKLSTSIKHAQLEHYTHSKLCHPNIASVGDSSYLIEYRQQSYTAFTVESAETDLQQLLEVMGSFPELVAVNVLRQLLEALTYLHVEMNVAHYDVKPSNILVTRDEQVKLTDFDLTRNVKEPITSSSVGTLRYLPPECFRANFGNCDATAEKADVWMVGIVYYLMLFGKHPICSDKMTHDDARLALSHFRGDLCFPAPISDLSRWLCQSCLHPDPRCRPTASQLLIALRGSLEQQQQQRQL